MDIATATDLIGVETRGAGFLLRGREPLKYRSAVFALGERINILKVLSNNVIFDLATTTYLYLRNLKLVGIVSRGYHSSFNSICA